MNKTDWEDFLMMELTIGAQNLETAAANISSLLPFQVNRFARMHVYFLCAYMCFIHVYQ